MKKILMTTLLAVLVACTAVAQEESIPFKKNEIGFSTFHLGYDLSIYQGEQFAFNNYSRSSLYYRYFLKDNLALRFDGSFGLTGSSNQTNIMFNGGIGLEKYRKITDKLYWYTGAQLYGAYRQPTEFLDNRSYGIGLDLLGGLRYQITKNISVSTEWVLPMRYHWSPELNSGAFNTGIYNNAIKLGITF